MVPSLRIGSAACLIFNHGVGPWKWAGWVWRDRPSDGSTPLQAGAFISAFCSLSGALSGPLITDFDDSHFLLVCSERRRCREAGRQNEELIVSVFRVLIEPDGTVVPSLRWSPLVSSNGRRPSPQRRSLADRLAQTLRFCSVELDRVCSRGGGSFGAAAPSDRITAELAGSSLCKHSPPSLINSLVMVSNSARQQRHRPWGQSKVT